MTLFIHRSLRQSLYKYVDIILTPRAVLIDYYHHHRHHVKNTRRNDSDETHVEDSVSVINYNNSDRSNDIFYNRDKDERDHHPNHHKHYDGDDDDEHDSSTIQDCNNQWYIRHNNPLVPIGFISPGHTNQMGFLSIIKNHQGISIRNDLQPI